MQYIIVNYSQSSVYFTGEEDLGMTFLILSPDLSSDSNQSKWLPVWSEGEMACFLESNSPVPETAVADKYSLAYT